MTIATRKDDAAETIVETAETTENAALGTDTNDEGVMTAEDLAALCESRSETYSFLARLFREEVDEALLAQLNDTDYPVSSGNGLMDEGYYQIAKYLSNAWVDPLMKLSVDYTRAFLGSGIDTYSAAYPFESVYTSEKRLLMSDARDEVLAIYRSCGLEKSESWTVGEDLVAVELENVHHAPFQQPGGGFQRQVNHNADGLNAGIQQADQVLCLFGRQAAAALGKVQHESCIIGQILVHIVDVPFTEQAAGLDLRHWAKLLISESIFFLSSARISSSPTSAASAPILLS